MPGNIIILGLWGVNWICYITKDILVFIVSLFYSIACIVNVLKVASHHELK